MDRLRALWAAFPPGQLWRMSALRQAIILTALFIGVLIGAGIYSIVEVRQDLARQSRDLLAARHAALERTLASGSLAPREITSEPGLPALFIPKETGNREVYDGFFGRRGLFSSEDTLPGQATRQNRFAPDAEPRWLYFGGPVTGGWLIVGRDTSDLEVFDEVLVESFTWVGAMAAGTAVILGLFFGWRSQTRLSAITRTLDRASQGDLSARVNATGRSDDIHALGLQVDEAIARIDVALTQARGFSANIAHDLKTPLTRLRIRLETALTGDGDLLDAVGAALEQTDHVIAVFDAFLQLAKLESGALRQQFKPLDLAELMADIAETYAPVVEDSGRHLTTDLSPAPTLGDRVLLTQLVANLIENALRHTPPGSTLTLRATPAGFGLIDDGPGIPQAERARVLEPLYRLERSRTTPGAGLGLSLARTIADQHGARLVLDDAPAGQGLSALMVFGEKA